MVDSTKAFIAYDIVNRKEFDLALDKASDIFDDFRIPFKLIALDFYASNRAHFGQSPGRLADLKRSTKRAKDNLYKHHYPILVATGRLRDSVTGSTAPNEDTIQVINRRSMLLGTKVPYGKTLQNGIPGKMERRPWFGIVPEAFKGFPETAGRPQRWKSIVEAFGKSKLRKEGFDIS